MSSHQKAESKKRLGKVVKTQKEANLPAQNFMSTEIILPNTLLESEAANRDGRQKEPGA